MHIYHHDHHSDGRRVLITAPGDLAVTVVDAKKGLGIDPDDTSQDVMVEASLGTAIDALDPAAGGWLGRALATQTWELQLRSFGDHRHLWPRVGCERAIVLPFPPLQDVLSVKYLDVNGVDQTLALGTDYRVLGMGQVYGKAYIAPVFAGSWPACRIDDASVRVQFTCGYDGDDLTLPRSIQSAIILGVRSLMSLTSRDMLLFEDSVEGLGYKRYQNNPAIADVLAKAMTSLLTNMAIS